MPDACPVCGTADRARRGRRPPLLPEPACPARVSQEFGHFVGRGGMDVEGAGWAVLEQLLQRGLVKTPRRLLPADGRGARRRSTGSRARVPRTCTRPSSSRAAAARWRILTASGSRRSAGRRRSTCPLADRARHPPEAASGLAGAGRRPSRCRARRAGPVRGGRGRRADVRSRSPSGSADGPRCDVLRRLAEAGVEAELPAPAADGRGRRAARRARRSS